MKKKFIFAFMLFLGLGLFPMNVVAEESNLSIIFTDKVVADKATILVGDDFDPSTYATAYNGEKQIPLTDTGLGENGEFLGFTAEGEDVDVNKAGIYNVLYILRESSGSQISKTLEVRVEDKLVMDITNPIILYAGETFNPSLYGKAWRNNVSVPFGDLGPNGEFWGFIDNGDNVDTSKVGNYFIIYTLHGELPFHSLSKQIDVQVIAPTINIHYVNEESASIADSKTIEGKIGEKYTFAPLVIKGYTFKSVIGENSGEFIAGEKNITFVYASESTTSTTSSNSTTSTTSTSTSSLTSSSTVPGFTTSQSVKQSVSEASKKSTSLPKTGENKINIPLIFSGLFLIAVASFFIHKKMIS